MRPAIGLNASRSPFVLGIALVAVSTLLSGAIQGWMSNRWGPSRDMLAAAEKLQGIPDRIGDWQLQSSGDIEENTAKLLQCAGYIFREYRNEQTGESVRVAVLLGPSGPISVHMPEICYSGAGYSVASKTERVAVSTGQGSDEEFWAVNLRNNDLNAVALRVYYGWSTGGPWSAPDDARLKFVGSPYLYKIQLASDVPPGTDLATNDTCRSFLRDFAAIAREHFFDVSTK